MKKLQRVTKCSKPVSFFYVARNAGASGPKGRVIQEILSKINENQRTFKKNEEKWRKTAKKFKRYQKIPKDTKRYPNFA